MTIRLFNSLTRTVEPFVPKVAGQVGMYVCGMTVYDHCHIGHARMMMAFDIVQRWFKASGLQVRYVRNITDIDDKIINRANENGETIGQLTDRFIEAMNEDADRPLIREDAASAHEGTIDGIVRQLVVLMVRH